MNSICQVFARQAPIVLSLTPTGDTFLMLRSGFDLLSLNTLGITIKEVLMPMDNRSNQTRYDSHMLNLNPAITDPPEMKIRL